MESNSISEFKYTTNREMTSVLSSLASLQTNNFLTGIAVEVYPSSNCSDNSCSVNIRKSTIRRRFGSITLSLNLKKMDDGIHVEGYSEIDWASYWPIAMLVVFLAFAMIVEPQDAMLILIFGGIMSFIFVGVGFFEKDHMIEEVKQVL